MESSFSDSLLGGSSLSEQAPITPNPKIIEAPHSSFAEISTLLHHHLAKKETKNTKGETKET